MPLSFSSRSHGTVAFGFYNIETDGLLLEDHFFFCSDLCRAVLELARAEGPRRRASLDGHRFDDPRLIGDLMGAIHGTHLAGYLGEVYRRWPFPKDPRAFRQRLGGEANRPQVEALLARTARPLTIELEAEGDWEVVRIGPYAFSRGEFLELLIYLWRGGYPRWERPEADLRPPCVNALAPLLQTLSGPRP